MSQRIFQEILTAPIWELILSDFMKGYVGERSINVNLRSAAQFTAGAQRNKICKGRVDSLHLLLNLNGYFGATIQCSGPCSLIWMPCRCLSDAENPSQNLINLIRRRSTTFTSIQSITNKITSSLVLSNRNIAGSA